MSGRERPYSIRFDAGRSMLRAHVTGVNGTFETSLGYWLEIAAEVRRVGPESLLVVDDMSGEVPPAEQLARLVEELMHQGFEGVRVAYVESDPEQIPEVEVAELHARERGYAFRVFGDEASARVWLQYGDS